MAVPPDDGRKAATLYESIPLVPQLKNYGYTPSSMAENAYTSDRTNGVCVNYEDHGGVWQFLYPSLSQRLPLRGIVWKNHLQTNKTIDRLHVNFQHIPSGGGAADTGVLDTSGLVFLFVVKCEDMETYKTKIKPVLSAWVDRMTLHHNEWLVLYVPLGTQATAAPASASRGLTSAFSQTFRDSSKVYRKIFERMKIDFADKTVKMDRICKIEVLEGNSVVGGVPGQQQQHESQWSEVLIKLKTCIMDAFDTRCAEYEEQLRHLDGKRALSGWDFSSFLQVKESLALLYIQATLFDDAIRHYDELEAIYTSVDVPSATSRRLHMDKSDPILTATPFDIDMTSVRMNIAVNAASPLYIRLYLFCRQVAISYLMDAHGDVCTRGLDFIPQFLAMLQQIDDLPPTLPLQWAVGAALALCVSCEHEVDRDHGEAMAKHFGELLYLARRHCKALVALPTTASSSSSSWYHSLQSPDVLNDITHLASVQFARAGRARFAAFLGGQCARHAIAAAATAGGGIPDDTCCPRLLTQMQQYEKDQWWALMYPTVDALIATEIRRGHLEEAIDLCIHWMKLDAARDVWATVFAMWVDALAQAAAQDVVVPVVWTHLFEPTVVVTQASLASVQLQLTLKNTLGVAIVLDHVDVLFDQTSQRQLHSMTSMDDCLSLESLVPSEVEGGTHSRMRATTAATMTNIDDFTASLNHEATCTDLPPATPTPTATNKSMVISLAECALAARDHARFDLKGVPCVGHFVCHRVNCRLGAYAFSLPLDEPVAFDIEHAYKSTMAVTVECAPLLLPSAATPLVVVVDPKDDALLGGRVVLRCRGARGFDHPTGGDDTTQEIALQVPPTTSIWRAEVKLTSGSADDATGRVDVDVECHYAFTHASTAVLRRLACQTCHVTRPVAPPVEAAAVSTKRVGDRAFVQIQLRCNDVMGLYIDPAAYELICPSTGVNLLNEAVVETELRVLANPNAQLQPLTLLPSSTWYACFVLQVPRDDVALPEATSGDHEELTLRLFYKTALDGTDVATAAAAVAYDVRLRDWLPRSVPTDAMFHLTTRMLENALSTSSSPPIRRSQWVDFAVDVTPPKQSYAHEKRETWIALDASSARYWICAGPAVQCLRSDHVQFRLRPLHLGRLPLPSFMLTTRPCVDARYEVCPVDASHVQQAKTHVVVVVG
ncbi:Aste57867_20148 [Aphanomyces stellatus]|uniref:Aste57867_20148 protein n=1 Tax=Aphanomyces stellatus TaxID=120398 RepID=A0A485LEB5_9STRA|nr:hypothetical protein As57867_020082 [Aphanomyces stellatus]VFT96843.1 Aste57867_20148 [Aphanomyces stellatus]